MTTRTTIRGLIRNELNDNAATKLWADADLNAWLNDAIRDYSRALPKASSTTIAMVAGTAAYNLPADCDQVLRVEEPTGTLRVPIDQGEHGYRLQAGQIVLDPVPSAGTLTLTYNALYAVPTADGDTLTTPSTDDDLLIDLVISRALEWIDRDEAKRMRFERQRGSSPRSLAQQHRRRFDQAVDLRQHRVRSGSLLAY